MTDKEKVMLKVGELTNREEFGRGIVRLDTKTMHKLRIKEGDVVEIHGKQLTAAIAVRAYPADVGLNIIRMDGITRRNSGIGVGETIKVSRAEPKEAQRIVLAPAQKGIMLHMSPDLLKKNLFMRPVSKKDIIMPFPVVKQRRQSPFDDFFGMNIEDIFFTPIPGETKLAVVSTVPEGLVRITESTEVELKPEAVDILDDSRIPTLTYEDIGGLHEEIKKIREMVELPLRHPELFTRLGIDPPKGVLLKGPPGSGKTLLAKAVANESGAHFTVINGPEVMSKWYGQSEENLRKIFEDAEKNAPAIIFFDEIDAIAPKREEVSGEVERRVVSQILTLMDGLKSRGKVIVIAATNRPNALDPALRRPGRFDREVEIGVPDQDGRREILQIHTRNMPLHSWDDSIAARLLLSRIRNYEENAKGNIEENHDKIHELMSQGKDIQKEIADIEDELGQLQKEKRHADETLLERAISMIKGKEADVNRLRRKIDDSKSQIKRSKEEVSRLEDGISSTKTLRKDIKKYRPILEKIVKEINEIQHQREIRRFDDIRNRFFERIDAKSNKDVKRISDILMESGVISNEYINDVVIESVNNLIEFMTNITYGFVGADLESLSKEAAMLSLRRNLPELSWKSEEEFPAKMLENIKVTKSDFENALKVVEPSAMREVLVEIPKVTWDDVGGLSEVKQNIKEAVQWPLEHPDAFDRIGIRPPKGILLYGPPGTGKTLLAKAVANESGANFISIKGPEVLNKWVGESEKRIREIFKRAKQVAPTIIFFDEIDAIAPRRGMDGGSRVNENVVSMMLTEMSGLEELHNVVVIAATNRPDMIDPALLRPGRFDRQIIVPAPDVKAREEIFKIHTRGMPLDKSVSGMGKFAKETDGFSGADIEALVREAGLNALRNDFKVKIVTSKDFNDALGDVSPSINSDMTKFYDQIAQRLKTKVKKKSKTDEEMVYVG